MKDERRPATIKSNQVATAMRACGRSQEEQHVATALLFQLDPDAFADGTAEQQSDAEAEWNSTTRDGKLTRLCESSLNYLCAKSRNDIDRKADARTLVFVQDFERRLCAESRNDIDRKADARLQRQDANTRKGIGE